MPTYEYRCPKGHDFERFYKTISGSVAEVECPECGALAGRRLSGGAGLMFKGSGFYLTDYGKNAHRGSGAKSPPAGGEGGAKSESPKGDAPVTGAPKTDAPKADAPKTDAARPAAPKAGSPKSSPKSSPKKPKSE